MNLSLNLAINLVTKLALKLLPNIATIAIFSIVNISQTIAETKGLEPYDLPDSSICLQMLESVQLRHEQKLAHAENTRPKSKTEQAATAKSELEISEVSAEVDAQTEISGQANKTTKPNQQQSASIIDNASLVDFGVEQLDVGSLIGRIRVGARSPYLIPFLWKKIKGYSILIPYILNVEDHTSADLKLPTSLLKPPRNSRGDMGLEVNALEMRTHEDLIVGLFNDRAKTRRLLLWEPKSGVLVFDQPDIEAFAIGPNGQFAYADSNQIKHGHISKPKKVNDLHIPGNATSTYGTSPFRRTINWLRGLRFRGSERVLDLKYVDGYFMAATVRISSYWPIAKHHRINIYRWPLGKSQAKPMLKAYYDLGSYAPENYIVTGLFGPTGSAIRVEMETKKTGDSDTRVLSLQWNARQKKLLLQPAKNYPTRLSSSATGSDQKKLVFGWSGETVQEVDFGLDATYNDTSKDGKIISLNKTKVIEILGNSIFDQNVDGRFIATLSRKESRLYGPIFVRVLDLYTNSVVKEFALPDSEDELNLKSYVIKWTSKGTFIVLKQYPEDEELPSGQRFTTLYKFKLKNDALETANKDMLTHLIEKFVQFKLLYDELERLRGRQSDGALIDERIFALKSEKLSFLNNLIQFDFDQLNLPEQAIYQMLFNHVDDQLESYIQIYSNQGEIDGLTRAAQQLR